MNKKPGELDETNISKSNPSIEKIEDDEKLRQYLLFKTDQLSEAKFSDTELDKHNEREFLLKYREHNPRKTYIKNEINPYLDYSGVFDPLIPVTISPTLWADGI